MHKMRALIPGFVLLIILVAVGCDDDCPDCPDFVTPLGHTRGTLMLSPGAVMPDLQVYSNGAVAPNLDSVKVGDSLIGRQYWNLSSQSAYADAHWVIHFNETGDTTTFMYEHGDDARISVWGEGRFSFCQLRILDPFLAAAQITDPTPNTDTIAPGGSDTIYWDKVEFADYYAIMIAWLVTSGGGSQYTFNYYYTTDTSFIITGAMQPPDSMLSFNVHVTPFNGPDPQTGQTNWTGTLLDGVVYSIGYDGMTTIIVRSPVTPPEKQLPEPGAEYREHSPESIVACVYKKYAK